MSYLDDMKSNQHIALIGAGIMSATLGILLKELFPDCKITILERLDRVGAESSDAWNNAGTGHSAFCELNYTPQREDGSVDLTKALKIAGQFEVSKQLWSYLKENGRLPDSESFINDISHMSYVWGEENVQFLRKRYASMTKYAIFDEMAYSEDRGQVSDWVPLMMDGRKDREAFGVTRMDIGTDVNFGAITRGMMRHLDESSEGVDVYLGHEVEQLTHLSNGNWQIDIQRLEDGKSYSLTTDAVFIGAGGGALPLLDKADLPEARGYGGFPVSGQFLACQNPEIVKQHKAKVYGKAAVGSPPMSVPHLDSRKLDGEWSLLFGPYAGFSTKFLKNGSYLDLPLSIEMHNVWPMLSAGIQNIGLTKYLIKQVIQSKEDRFEFLRQYYPDAKMDDWELITAGQRVQIIKKDPDGGGVLKFGTEVVCSDDRSMTALLGASPGASTSVSIMLDVLHQMFPDEMKESRTLDRLKKMIPSYGESLIDNKDLVRKTRDWTSTVLKLDD